MSEELNTPESREAFRMQHHPEMVPHPGPLAELMGGNVPEMAAALAAAQGAMANPMKDSANPHFGSTYTSLAGVLNAVREPLAANHLAVVQMPSAEGARVTVRTLLVHKSGGWLCTTVTATAKDSGPQGIGSVITYLRRYSLAAMCGVAQEDDDGESGQPRLPGDQGQQRSQEQGQRGSGKKTSPQQQRTQRERPAAAPATPTQAPEPELPPIPETLKKAPAVPETIGKLEKRLVHPHLTAELRNKVLGVLERSKVHLDMTFDAQGDGSATGATVKDAGKLTEFAAQTMVRDMEDDIRTAAKAAE